LIFYYDNLDLLLDNIQLGDAFKSSFLVYYSDVSLSLSLVLVLGYLFE